MKARTVVLIETQVDMVFGQGGSLAEAMDDVDRQAAGFEKPDAVTWWERDSHLAVFEAYEIPRKARAFRQDEVDVVRKRGRLVGYWDRSVDPEKNREICDDDER